MSSFLGRGWAFPPKLSNSDRQVALVTDDTDIRQAIQIIVMTVPGERVMHPDFGCRIHELVFAPANDQTAAVAERYVREAIERWEPRINVRAIHIDPQPGADGHLAIEVKYEIKGTHDVRNLVYPFYLLPRGE